MGRSSIMSATFESLNGCGGWRLGWGSVFVVGASRGKSWVWDLGGERPNKHQLKR